MTLWKHPPLIYSSFKDMRNLKSLLSLAACTAVICTAQFNGLKNLGSSCYMNTALQAISSIPAASNLILSVDPKTLPNKNNQDILLKLQTILYTLRTEGVTLKDAYLLDFLKSVGTNFVGGWSTKGQQDASEFYQNLVQTIERDLLPIDKRATFHDLMNVKQEITSPSRNTTEDDLLVRIQGTSAVVNSVQSGLDEYFKVQSVTTTAGTSSLQHRIAADPFVLSIYVNRFPTDAADKNNKQITIPMKLAINNYRSANLAGNTSPDYELRHVAVHRGDRPNTGHYYGYRYDGNRWIKLDDSNVHAFKGDVTEITSHGQDTAFMLYYVNARQKDDLLRENPVPKNVMTLIDGELAKHAIVVTTITDPKRPSSSKPKNDASGLASGLFHLFAVVVIALLN